MLADAHPGTAPGATLGGPPQVILRVKRRREDSPVDVLVLEAEAAAAVAGSRKKAKTRGIDLLSEQVAALSTHADAATAPDSADAAEQRRGVKRQFLFTRVETVDADDAQHGGRFQMARQAMGRSESAYREVRRFRSTSMNGAYPPAGHQATPMRAYHLIDLAPRKAAGLGGQATLAAAATPSAVESEVASAAAPVPPSHGDVEKRGAPPAAPERAKGPYYIFRPLERELDEAIFRAFKDPSALRDVVEKIARGADVDFQRRNADDTTALMAAAFQGDVAVVARLLRLGANPRLRDVHGKTALDLARDGRQHACELMLSQAVAEADEGDEEDQGYVFDVYAVQRAVESGGADGVEGVKGPVVHVEGLTFQEGEEPVLVFEDDSDWSGADENDDEDSNAEDYYANDYPDESDADDDMRGGESDVSDDSDAEGCVLRDHKELDLRSATQRHLAGGLIARGGLGIAALGGRVGPFAVESESSDEGDHVYTMGRGCCMADYGDVAFDPELDLRDD